MSAVATLTLLAACSSPPTAEPEADHAVDLPGVSPLQHPIKATDVPTSPDARPSRNKIAQAADSTRRGRSGAETFALQVTQAISDVRRPALNIGDVLESFGCDRLPGAVRDAVVQDTAAQVRAETGGHWIPDEALWIRSERASRGFGVELAAVMTDGGQNVWWNRFRIDVGKKDDRWCVAGVGAEPFLPEDPSIDRADADIRDSLVGIGWREIRS